jgi:benzylsuccinate CoA-transferase BbsF subunit
MSSLLGDAILEYGSTGKPPEPAGNRSSEAAPYGVYRCQGNNRWCAISVFSNEEWLRFKRALGNPPWAEAQRFTTLSRRLENVAELDRLVGEWTINHTAEKVMAVLQEQGIAAGVVQDARDLANDPQLKARDFFVELDHPELDKTTSDATPIKLSETPAGYHRAAPILGQDNDYVYRQLLSISEEELTELRQQGVIS